MTQYQQKDGIGGPDDSPQARAMAERTGKSAPGHRKTEARSRIFRELVKTAAEQGASIPLGISTADALQECLDRAVALMRFAQDQVDKLAMPVAEDEGGDIANSPSNQDPLFEVLDNPQGPDVIQPHRYLAMEREARIEVEKLAGMMTQLGIAERVVRVEEAKAALLVAAVREAALEVGLNNDQIRALGGALRHRVEEGLQRKQPAHGTVKIGQKVTREVERLSSSGLPAPSTST